MLPRCCGSMSVLLGGTCFPRRRGSMAPVGSKTMESRMPNPDSLRPGVERFLGFAPVYDRFRPQPPEVAVDVLCQIAQVERPGLVVDLGCGTGLSTRIWAGRAERVIGIEPSLVPFPLEQLRS